MFIVEDGTGIENANSYISVEDADLYFASMGSNPNWAKATSDIKQNALIVGTTYLDLKNGAVLKGGLLKLTQGLEFPRINITDRYGRVIKGVPVNIKDATCEYASLFINKMLYPKSVPQDTSIKSKTTKVGPITTSVSYSEIRKVVTFYNHPLPDSLVQPFINPALNNRSGTIRA